MTQNIEDAQNYLPHKLVPLFRWITPNKDVDARTKLLDLAHDAKTPQLRRDAYVTLAKMDWAEANLQKTDYDLRVYSFPLWQMGYADENFYRQIVERGGNPAALLYQVCLSFNDELSYLWFKMNVGELH